MERLSAGIRGAGGVGGFFLHLLGLYDEQPHAGFAMLWLKVERLEFIFYEMGLAGKEADCVIRWSLTGLGAAVQLFWHSYR